MGPYDELEVGERFSTPSVKVTEEDAATLVRIGGYSHPLFTDARYASRSAFGRPPLPGQAVLLVMGGLVEQSGRFDESVIALVGFEDVSFRAPAFPGEELHVEIEVLDKEPREGRGVLVMRWTCLRTEDVVAEARARMLFSR